MKTLLLAVLLPFALIGCKPAPTPAEKRQAAAERKIDELIRETDAFLDRAKEQDAEMAARIRELENWRDPAREARIEEMAEAFRRAQATPTPVP